MPSGCCSNCRTKYSLFNPENGCSSCAFSFCSKCIGYKALIPRLADKPVSVCYNCYQMLNDRKIRQPVQNTFTVDGQPANSQQWWGNDLPPPSFRQSLGNTKPTLMIPKRSAPSQQPCKPEQDPTVQEFEQRLAALKANESSEPIPSLEEIENRLAALRECDVEVIRNPRSWFATSSKDVRGDDPLALMKNAKARAQLEEEFEARVNFKLHIFRYDPDNVLQRRFNELKDGQEKDLEGADDKARMSMVSGTTEFSEATKEELEQINKLMNEAEQTVKEANESLKDDESVRKELNSVMSRVRQKSIDVDKTNCRVQQEFSGFWDKQIQKQIHDDSDDDIDDETVRKIVAEVEAMPDEQPAIPKTSSSQQKKKHFFNKLFKR